MMTRTDILYIEFKFYIFCQKYLFAQNWNGSDSLPLKTSG